MITTGKILVGAFIGVALGYCAVVLLSSLADWIVKVTQ